MRDNFWVGISTTCISKINLKCIFLKCVFQSECASLHKTVNMVVFFVKSNLKSCPYNDKMEYGLTVWVNLWLHPAQIRNYPQGDKRASFNRHIYQLYSGKVLNKVFQMTETMRNYKCSTCYFLPKIIMYVALLTSNMRHFCTVVISILKDNNL